MRTLLVALLCFVSLAQGQPGISKNNPARRSSAPGQEKQYHYALFEDGTICIDYTFCCRHAYHAGKRVIAKGDNNDFEEWWGWGRNGRKLYAQYRLGKITKEEFQSEIIDEAIVATAEGKTSWSREPRPSKTQERVHRPAQELQDKCVVYRGACTMRHHYVPLHGDCLTLQDFVSLWDEYKRECWADSTQATYDVYEYDGQEYFSGLSIDPGIRQGYKGRRTIWEHRELTATDFLDWLSKKVKK